MGLKELLALHKVSRLMAIIKWNGGFVNSFKKMMYHDDLKIGTLVGMDQYGNKYYENSFYFFGRNRWVEYNPASGYDYDASKIPPEWFGWMHHKTDLTPCEDPNRPRYTWIKPHQVNVTGTQYQYVPYDTTRPKIEAWRPPRPCSGTRLPKDECDPEHGGKQ